MKKEFEPNQNFEQTIKIIENIRWKEDHTILEENLRELIGLTPLEVIVGAVLGAMVAFIMS